MTYTSETTHTDRVQLGATVQRIQVTVRGGYHPGEVRVRQGVPVDLVFDRQEAGACTDRVVFDEPTLTAELPAHQTTTLRLTPTRAGRFGFTCGTGMARGTLVVEPATEDGSPEAVTARSERRWRYGSALAAARELNVQGPAQTRR